MSVVGSAPIVRQVSAALRTGPVGAFVLTFRRQEPLAETLQGLLAQTRRPETITVLNADETTPLQSALAEAFPAVEVIDLERNPGSAGGFGEALRIGFQRGASWIWLLDDDSVPSSDGLRELLAVAEAEQDERGSLGVLAPLQMSLDRRFGVARWRDRIVNIPQEELRGTAPIDVDVAYWAGLLVHRGVVDRVGYPRAEFFRCFGDYEYCLRARGAGFRVVAVPASRVEHDHGPPNRVVRLGRPSVRLRYPPSRYYYHVRNAGYTMRFVLRSPLAVARHVLTQIRQMVGDLIYSDQKLRRVQMRLLGLVDGLRGRLGRRPDLE
jgi:rhamnopyranosyl-N-acetylglucosaminyl-diphospho-decaprenol beta-1,3/1,4-galactofuranosyltransferase